MADQPKRRHVDRRGFLQLAAMAAAGAAGGAVSPGQEPGADEALSPEGIVPPPAAPKQAAGPMPASRAAIARFPMRETWTGIKESSNG